MHSKKQIAFICGDNRQIYLANLFSENGWIVYTYNIDSPLLSNNCIKCKDLKSAINHCNIVVFPFKIRDIPIDEFFSSESYFKNKTIFGGNISNDFIEFFFKNKIEFYDFFKVDYITRLNAIATAEGCIKEAIEMSPYNLHNASSLVLGYGNCGSVLAHKLSNLNSYVTIACRKPYQGACAISEGIKYINISHLESRIKDFNYIFNTIPSTILTPNMLEKINKDCVIIDIASSPGGIDLEYAHMINLKAKTIPGIPGKVSPLSSAIILYDYINDVISI